MVEDSVEHPYEELYTLEERRILAWPEQALPEALPDEITGLAIRGVELHPFFEGREVWFWPLAQIGRLIDFIEQHNAGVPTEQTLWVVHHDMYAAEDGRLDFSSHFTFGQSAPGAFDLPVILRSLYLEPPEEFQGGVAWFYFATGFEEPTKVNQHRHPIANCACIGALAIAALVVAAIVYFIVTVCRAE